MRHPGSCSQATRVTIRNLPLHAPRTPFAFRPRLQAACSVIYIAKPLRCSHRIAPRGPFGYHRRHYPGLSAAADLYPPPPSNSCVAEISDTTKRVRRTYYTTHAISIFQETRRCRVATITVTLEEKLAGQKQVKALEVQRNKKRRSLFDSQDEIDERRGRLIEGIEGKLEQKAKMKELFAVGWELV